MKRIEFTLDVPVFQGGMGVGVSLGGLAGAVAAEGGAGTISTAQIGFREDDFQKHPLQANLRAIGKEIAKAKEIAGGRGMVGVNIMTVTRDYAAYVREAVRCGADFIVSGAGLPMDLPLLTADSRVRRIPVVSSLKAAQVICKRWLKKGGVLPDAVIIEGPKAGGHLGFTPEEAKNQEAGWYEEEIQKIISFLRSFGHEHGSYIPAITAGGLGTHQDLLRQQELGADAVQLATRFVVTEECDAAPAYKQAYLDCSREDIEIIKSPVGMPGRAIRNSFIDRAKQGRIPPERCLGCLSVCDPSATPYCITQALIRAVTGDTENGLLFCGANAWREDRITTVREVIQGAINGVNSNS
jgi:NAD(P)H-dependent flavin oxidoreductase YrpB (nitropropane dioxygenase family)